VRSKLQQCLRSESGASLVFVLAIMLLLMAISLSALTAASAAAGTGVGKQSENQLELYSDSVQKTLMYSLQNGDSLGININGTSTLGGQLMNVLYDKATAAPHPGETQEPFKLVLENPQLDGKTIAESCLVTISVEPRVSIRETYTESYPIFDAEGNETGSETVRYPQEATLAATVTIRTDLSLRGKAVISAVQYEYSKGFLQDDLSNATNMLIQNLGEWRFVSYDKVDKRVSP